MVTMYTSNQIYIYAFVHHFLHTHIHCSYASASRARHTYINMSHSRLLECSATVFDSVQVRLVLWAWLSIFPICLLFDASPISLTFSFETTPLLVPFTLLLRLQALQFHWLLQFHSLKQTYFLCYFPLQAHALSSLNFQLPPTCHCSYHLLLEFLFYWHQKTHFIVATIVFIIITFHSLIVIAAHYTDFSCTVHTTLPLRLFPAVPWRHD